MLQRVRKYRSAFGLGVSLAVLFVLLAGSVAAQPKAPTAILNQYRAQRTTWFTMVWPYANTLFGLLAVIEFAWSAAVMLLDKSDMQSWTSALVRKLMWLGAFYALLIYGRSWIPAIIDSFELIGQQASGTGPLAPSDVFTRGIDIAGALMATSSTAAFFTNLGTSLAMIVTGVITALAFIAITVQFVVAMVESYIIVAAGFIFVGFGGSRWTAPYVERYIGLGVATGVKIMLLYLLIATGMTLSVDWMTDAQKITANSSPAMSALEIMGASIIFMMLCWQIPKLFAAVLGGSPALSGGDLIASGAFVAGGALAAGSLALGAAGGLAGGSRALSAGGVGGAGGVASGTSASSGVSAPAMMASVGSSSGGTAAAPSASPADSAGGPTQPAAPSSRSTANSSSPPRSSAFADSARKLTGVRRQISPRLPSDAGPHATPPRMDIDHHD
jgi:type IV secretion system protein TrbL